MLLEFRLIKEKPKKVSYANSCLCGFTNNARIIRRDKAKKGERRTKKKKKSCELMFVEFRLKKNRRKYYMLTFVSVALLKTRESVEETKHKRGKQKPKKLLVDALAISFN